MANLDNIEKLLNEYFELILAKQKAIKDHDIETLNQLVIREEELYCALNDNQGLQKVFEELKNVQHPDIVAYKKRIRELILKIEEENRKLIYLAVNARKLVHEVVTSLMSTRKKSLIDRKM